MRRGRFLLILSLLFACTHFTLSQSTICSDAEVERTAGQVDAARRVLLAVPIGNGLDSDVPPEAQRGILSLKAALGDYVDSYMRCVPSDTGREDVETDLSNRISGLDEGLEDRYGSGLEFHARVASDRPGLVGITAEFGIECGSDTVLFVFARQKGSWREVLRWQSDPYDTVAGGFWSFDYGISPPDDSGDWYVVTKFIHPWCSSTWSSIDYSVLRPSVSALKPKVLLAGSDEIWWGADDYGKLEVDRNYFDLRFHSSSIDGGVHNRVWIRRFSVIGDSVQRIAPVAVSPRDFVDEWIVSSWDDAWQWSVPSGVGLSRTHGRLHKKGSVSFEYDSVRRCSDAPHRYQVEVADDKHSYYFQVLGEMDYKMKAVSEKPSPACSGEDILETMATK